MALEKGGRIDRYEIRELIGRGGRGAVYRAVDTKLGRAFALKIVEGAAGEGGDDRQRERFMRDVLAASEIHHQNVVQVLDFGLADGATPYLVMEYLPGETLESLLRRQGGPLDVAKAVDIALAAGAGLRACHDAGIVHGGVNARKIFLANTDLGIEVKVRDVGLSAAPAAPADDLRALGAVLEACLAPRLPDALNAIVAKAMGGSPGDRYESVQALGEELLPFASPRGQQRWRRHPSHKAPPDSDAPVATSSQTPAILTRVEVPAKQLDRTQLLPEAERDPGGINPHTLPFAVAGGTVLDHPTGGPSYGSGSSLAAAEWAARTPAARTRRSWLVPLIATAGGLLVAIVVYVAFGGSPARVETRANPPQVTPSVEAPEAPVPPRVTPRPEPPVVLAPRAALPPPDPTPAVMKHDRAKPAPARKHASSRRRKHYPVDDRGIGIIPD
jgi:serine/threonine-protein kinase